MIFANQQVPDPVTVTPGLAGFLTFAALAVVVILLVLNMSKHLRRVDARAAQEAEDERIAQAEAARASGTVESPPAAEGGRPDPETSDGREEP